MLVVVFVLVIGNGAVEDEDEKEYDLVAARRAALCCIAELHSASRWETPARWTDPTACRLEVGDTAD